MSDPIKSTMQYTRELFAHFEEFFLRATGKTVTEFAAVENFGDAIRAGASGSGPRLGAALHWLDTNVRAFHSNRGGDAFRDTQLLGGMNLVLGGASQFLQGQLNSVSTAILYSDTVLIPDPVMPWLEKDRAEEKFLHVQLLESVHTLLQLKPLVNADLPYPPIVVFPSWEKLLEEHDDQTQKGIMQISVDVLSNSLGENLVDIKEICSFADRNPDNFLETVDRYHLFIAPHGPINEPLGESIKRYEEYVATWRSDEWRNEYNRLPIHRRVLYGILERIGPIYHLIENAQEFNSHPLMCLEQHAHYFRLVSQASSARLERLKLLDPRTTALVNALSSRRLRWLGGVPADILAKLRLENENLNFRGRLAASVAKLHDSDLNDVDRVAAEVCHDIEGAIGEHDKELRSIQERYNRAHRNTAVLAVAAVGAALIPALAPFLGTTATPFALATKYGHDKYKELDEKRLLSQSLFGVLAAAQPEV